MFNHFWRLRKHNKRNYLRDKNSSDESNHFLLYENDKTQFQYAISKEMSKSVDFIPSIDYPTVHISNR